LPEDLGLIRSSDGGATWESISLRAVIARSDDAGRGFEEIARLTAP
jgi:hypothetical protein